MKRHLSIYLIFLLYSCVDRIELDKLNLDSGFLVVEGHITDEIGPYTVRLFKTSNSDDN